MAAPPDYKIVLDPHASSLANRIKHNSQVVELGAISISTQGLAGNMFVTSTRKSKMSAFPYLEKGQVHRYALQISKISYTNMHDKETLIAFYQKQPKILIRRVISRQDRLLATYHAEEMVFKKDINPFIIQHSSLPAKYILGILNSSLMSYLYINTSSIATKDDFRQTTLAELRRLPIRSVDFDNANEKKVHDEVVSLVDKMLELYKLLDKASFDSEKEPIQRQIAATDKKIDELVYKLYGLTEEEIKIVEGV